MVQTTRAGFNKALVAGALLTALSTSVWADPVKIAIANFGDHPQLNESITGFKKELTRQGFVEGKDVVYELSHTNFDSTLLPQMIAKLQAGKPKLMLTITTPVSQVAKKALMSSGIPIVFSVVTDPVAAKLTPSWDKGDTGITGSSDLQDMAAVMQFAHKLVPNSKRFGMPYNPGEANDVALLEKVKQTGTTNDYQIVSVGVDNANDVQQRIASLKGKVDVLYNPTSNLLQPATPAVSAAARQIGVPLMGADPEPVHKGLVVAAVAVRYEKVGENAGKIAARILKGEDPKNIAPMKPTLADHETVVSRTALKAFKMTAPAGIADCKCFVD
ncbi:ABC transporter substrate-binding protein (plasmid) [Diaphorobacter sp. HDW4B]|uniref:ABC transporter substrate-binding protein n=1 Tax=Diaphorobacter sp. HDW4B TaxID=2714925 RepID=UPI00140A523C|nr:ABC transporter substrate-binding protein [Diaphorobacter sp. HDW4B]QIL73852.1 ABC transporter substrate-binding protein [Diaphorobacter sp. HDW4B]